MKKHLLFTVFAYAYFGFGQAVSRLGFKAGWSPELVLVISISSIIIFVVAVFTSLEKVKYAIKQFEAFETLEEFPERREAPNDPTESSSTHEQ